MSKLSRTDLVRETKVEIRSLLLTCRLGIPFTKLDKDYQLFNGKRIDFRSMGYSSLKEFIDDIPDVARQNYDSDGFLVLHAVADDTTQHIASLVSRTKKKKPYKRGKPFTGPLLGLCASRTPSSYRGRRQPSDNFSRHSSSYRSTPAPSDSFSGNSSSYRSSPAQSNYSRPIPTQDDHSQPARNDFSRSTPLQNDHSQPARNDFSRPAPSHNDHSQPARNDFSRPTPSQNDKTRPTSLSTSSGSAFGSSLLLSQETTVRPSINSSKASSVGYGTPPYEIHTPMKSAKKENQVPIVPNSTRSNNVQQSVAYSVKKTLVEEEVVRKVMDVLKSYPNGIQLCTFQALYKKHYGQLPNMRLLDLFKAMDDKLEIIPLGFDNFIVKVLCDKMENKTSFEVHPCSSPMSVNRSIQSFSSAKESDGSQSYDSSLVNSKSSSDNGSPSKPFHFSKSSQIENLRVTIQGNSRSASIPLNRHAEAEDCSSLITGKQDPAQSLKQRWPQTQDSPTVTKTFSSETPPSSKPFHFSKSSQIENPRVTIQGNSRSVSIPLHRHAEAEDCSPLITGIQAPAQSLKQRWPQTQDSPTVTKTTFSSETPPSLLLQPSPKNNSYSTFSMSSCSNSALSSQAVQQGKLVTGKQKLDQKFKDAVKYTMTKFPNGLKYTELPIELKKFTGADINLKELGYSSLEMLVVELNGTVTYRYRDKQLIIYSCGNQTETSSNEILQDCMRSPVSSETIRASEISSRTESDFELIPEDSVGSGTTLPCQKIELDTKIIQVYISNIINPGQFWVQCAGHLSDNLEQLMDSMQVTYNRHSGSEYKFPSCMMHIGQLCAALDSSDNRWYRCAITGKAGSSAQVSLLDFGASITVTQDKLRILRTRYLQLAAQAIQARLSDIEPSNGQWTEQSVTFFRQLVKRRKLQTYITESYLDGLLSICLCDISNDEPLDVNRTLIHQGFAVSKKHMDKFQVIPEKLSTEILPSDSSSSCQSFESQKSESIESIVVTEKCIKFVRLTSVYSCHLIKMLDKLYIMSSEVSAMLWDKDLIRSMLRQRGVRNLQQLTLTRNENPSVFEELAKYDLAWRVNDNQLSVLVMYELPSVIRILEMFGLPAQVEEVKRKLEDLVESFNSNGHNLDFVCDKVSKNDPYSSNSDSSNLMEEKWDLLKQKRKNLLKQLQSSYSEKVIEEIRFLEKEMDMIESGAEVENETKLQNTEEINNLSGTVSNGVQGSEGSKIPNVTVENKVILNDLMALSTQMNNIRPFVEKTRGLTDCASVRPIFPSASVHSLPYHTTSVSGLASGLCHPMSLQPNIPTYQQIIPYQFQYPIHGYTPTCPPPWLPNIGMIPSDLLVSSYLNQLPSAGAFQNRSLIQEAANLYGSSLIGLAKIDQLTKMNDPK